jgi:hypothetical protein
VVIRLDSAHTLSGSAKEDAKEYPCCNPPKNQGDGRAACGRRALRIRDGLIAALASGLQEECVQRIEEHMTIFFGWINLAFGLLAAFAGVIVLRGVFRRTLSSAATVRFLRWSLVASLAGLMPLTRHLTPVQQTCIVSVYCSGAAIIAWLKFGLVGWSRRTFALSVTGILYFDVVFVATRVFRNPPLFTAPLANPLPFFQFVQILFAVAFIVLGLLAVRKCRIEPAGVPGLGTYRHTH